MRVCLIVVLCWCLCARAEAQEREIALTMPHYGYDLAYVGASAALYFTARYAITPRDGDTAPLDGRGTHAFVRRADVTSDVTVGLVLYGTPVLAFLIDGTRAGDYRRALRMPIVLVEAFAMTSAITAMIKNGGVCRPYAWQHASETCEDIAGIPDDPEEQRRSFPSGHAALSSSMGGALVGMWLLPSGRDDRLAPLALGMTALSITTSALRVRAGAHSLVDVGVGFGIGFGVGLGTAALHLRRDDARVSVSPSANGLVVHGAF